MRNRKQEIEVAQKMIDDMEDRDKTMWDFQREFEMMSGTKRKVKMKCSHCKEFFIPKNLTKKLCPECTLVCYGTGSLETPAQTVGPAV